MEELDMDSHICETSFTLNAEIGPGKNEPTDRCGWLSQSDPPATRRFGERDKKVVDRVLEILEEFERPDQLVREAQPVALEMRI